MEDRQSQYGISYRFTFRFLDKETDIELEIVKLISEQERNKWTEIPNYDEIDQEISESIQGFEEEKGNERSKVSHL